MNFLRNHKKLIIGIGIFVLALIGYMMFFAGEDTSEDAGLVVSSDTADGSLVGREIIVLLAQLQGIDLNTRVIESEAFQQLVDFNKPVASQPVGRANPFLPIGR